jgi:toxin YoeB
MYKFIKISVLALGFVGFYSTNFVEASSKNDRMVLHEKKETQPLKASSLFLGCFDEPDSSLDDLRDTIINDCVNNTIHENKRQDYEQLASWGDPYGMVALGRLYAKKIVELLKEEESKENANKITSLAHEAAQWHLLAFETHWLKKEGKSFKSAIDDLEELSNILQKKYKSKNKKYDDIRVFKEGILKIIQNVKVFYKDYKNIKQISGMYKQCSKFNMVSDEEKLLKYFLFKTYINPEETGDLLYKSDGNFLESSLRYKKIKQCWEQSKKHKYLYNLAFIYEEGLIQCKTDEERYIKSKKYYKLSKTPEAYYNLALLYEKKLILCKNPYEKSKKYYEFSKIPEAYYNLGNLYFNNHITCNTDEERYQEVKKCWEAAGTPEAFQALGVLYYDKYIPCKTDEERYQKSEYYWEQPKTASSSYNLGLLYYKKGSCEEAKKYWEASGAEALYNIGILYMNGHIEKSLSVLERYKKALKYFQDAFIGGYQEALKLEEDCQKLIALEKELNEQENSLNSEDNDNNNAIEEEKYSFDEEKIEITNEETNIDEEKKEEKVLEPKKKKMKEEIQEKRKQKKLLELEKAKTKRDNTFEKMKEKFSLNQQPSFSSTNETKSFKITFVDEKMREKFLEVRKSKSMGDKLQELIDDIKKCAWGLQGTGDSEVLKNDRSGQFSRRINGKDRLIYKPTENGIEILDCQGHYE